MTPQLIDGFLEVRFFLDDSNLPRCTHAGCRRVLEAPFSTRVLPILLCPDDEPMPILRLFSTQLCIDCAKTVDAAFAAGATVTVSCDPAPEDEESAGVSE